MVNVSSYRPRNPGHDYHGIGTYLITLVVSGREPLLGTLGNDAQHPEVHLTPLGVVVQHLWEQIPILQKELHNTCIAVHACVCMPEHFHGVIEVLKPMSKKSLGDIIQAFKAASTSRWQQMEGLGASSARPITDVCMSSVASPFLRQKAAMYDNEADLIRNLSKKRRREYYALVGRQQRPLFDENYDDTICLDSRHKEAMIAYVYDNPRRAIIRRLMPNVMKRTLHVQIGDRSYGTFGNLFLLRWANKIPVKCHRRHPLNGKPYESTDDYTREHKQWVDAIMGGQTVIVTPGISKGELLMKKECIERGFPLIHLQKEPISAFWKPERQRFDACANGSLLILAPWGLDDMKYVEGVPSNCDYSRFHNLNNLAVEICKFYGIAKIIRTIENAK